MRCAQGIEQIVDRNMIRKGQSWKNYYHLFF
jgi:hypothetical protein